MGFAIKTTPVHKLGCISEGLNDCLMKMQLPLGQKTNATLISAYAPTRSNPNAIKDRFHEELNSLISSVPKSERPITLGDFNARVGNEQQAWSRTIGKHGVGKCNRNGLLLLCAPHTTWPLPRPCSICQPAARQRGCILFHTAVASH